VHQNDSQKSLSTQLSTNASGSSNATTYSGSSVRDKVSYGHGENNNKADRPSVRSTSIYTKDSSDQDTDEDATYAATPAATTDTQDESESYSGAATSNFGLSRGGTRRFGNVQMSSDGTIGAGMACVCLIHVTHVRIHEHKL
jgi:hypothetical protein